MATPTGRSSPSAASSAGPSDLARRQLDALALHCCCGRVDCALLKKNCSVLETVEKDVHTAAQLGQVRFYARMSFASGFARVRVLPGNFTRSGPFQSLPVSSFWKCSLDVSPVLPKRRCFEFQHRLIPSS